MKTIFTSMLVLLLSGSGIAQKKIHNILSKSLPENLELSKERQKFKVTTNHYNGDIFGNLFTNSRYTENTHVGLMSGRLNATREISFIREI